MFSWRPGVNTIQETFFDGNLKKKKCEPDQCSDLLIWLKVLSFDHIVCMFFDAVIIFWHHLNNSHMNAAFCPDLCYNILQRSQICLSAIFSWKLCNYQIFHSRGLNVDGSLLMDMCAFPLQCPRYGLRMRVTLQNAKWVSNLKYFYNLHVQRGHSDTAHTWFRQRNVEIAFESWLVLTTIIYFVSQLYFEKCLAP